MKATKTEFKQCYAYRGFIIEFNEECWVIGKGSPSSYNSLDGANTKKEAMIKIDNWLINQ